MAKLNEIMIELSERNKKLITENMALKNIISQVKTYLQDRTMHPEVIECMSKSKYEAYVEILQYLESR